VKANDHVRGSGLSEVGFGGGPSSENLDITRSPLRPPERVQPACSCRRHDSSKQRMDDAGRAEGVDVIRLPPRSPNLNAFAERFVRSVKSECLIQMVFLGQASLRHAITHYMTHYHCERNHQGVGNRLLQETAGLSGGSGPVCRRQRLGGLLNFYHRAAAA